MDAVRFGRALGFGARQAAKTVVSAVDAATSENPTARKPMSQPFDKPTQASSSLHSATAPKTVPLQRAAKPAAQSVLRGKEVHQGFKQGKERFRESALRPFVRLSGVVWLEVMGVLFGIFALFALTAVIRLRDSWHTPGPERQQWLGSLGMLAVFGYFCVSSFVRAKRRERQR